MRFVAMSRLLIRLCLVFIAILTTISAESDNRRSWASFGEPCSLPFDCNFQIGLLCIKNICQCSTYKFDEEIMDRLALPADSKIDTEWKYNSCKGKKGSICFLSLPIKYAMSTYDKNFCGDMKCQRTFHYAKTLGTCVASGIKLAPASTMIFVFA